MTFDLFIAVLLLGGWLTSKLFERIGLPGVLGLTLFGVAWSMGGKDLTPDGLWKVTPFLQNFALVIILLRAGLGIKRSTLKKVGKTAMGLALLPCMFEGFTYFFLFKTFGGFSTAAAGTVGFLLAAVSPAVVVPSMLDLKEKGYGEKKEIPTMILAGASLDDVFAITFFSIFLTLFREGQPDLLMSLLQIPISISGGVLVGVLAGIILVFVFGSWHKTLRATEKSLILIGVSLFLLQVGKWTDTATLLGVMTIGFLILEKKEWIATELSLKLNKIWLIAQIWLFVLIGLSVDVSQLQNAGLQTLGFLFVGLCMRSFGVFLATLGSGLSGKEKVFTMISYLPKATVQAAMGSVPLAAGMPEGQAILAAAVLSIVVTAPLGLIGIRTFGPKLLEKS